MIRLTLFFVTNFHRNNMSHFNVNNFIPDIVTSHLLIRNSFYNLLIINILKQLTTIRYLELNKKNAFLSLKL